MAIADAAKRLAQFPLFEGLPPEVLQQIGGFVEKQTYRAGKTIFQPQDVPSYLYLVESGRVAETSLGPDGGHILRLQTAGGGVLGRWAVFNSEPYQTTATVIQSSTVLAISASNLRVLMSRFPLLRQRLQQTNIVSRLRAIPLLSSLSAEQLFQVADLVHVEERSAGEIIFEQGDDARAFYVIDTGQVQETAVGAATGQQTWPKYFTAGSFFGRYALKAGTKRRATARAVTDVRLFRLGSDVFHYLRQLDSQFDQALDRFDMLSLLRQERLFSKLSDEEIKHLAGFVGLVHYPKDTTIVYEGETDPTFYLLYDGEAVLRSRDELGRDRPTDYVEAGKGVGDTSLFFQGPSHVTLQSTTPTNWLYLSRNDLDQFLAQRPEAKDKLLPSSSVTAEILEKPFDWMDLDEQALLTRRRHWLAFIDKLAGWPLLILASAVGFLALLWWAIAIPFFAVLTLIFLALTALWVVWVVIDWLNDYFVVTTKRIVHREKLLLIREERFETPLAKVQNVNTQSGLMGNILGFGKLVIDTAATFQAEPVMFDYLGDPEGAKSLIFEEIERLHAVEQPEQRLDIRQKLEASLRDGIQLEVPKQVVPSAASASAMIKEGPLARVYGSTLGKWFWMEKQTEDQVIWRKHWLRLLQRVSAPTSAAILMLIIYLFLLRGTLWGLAGSLIVLGAIGFWWWWGWQDWGNDLYIVTNDRIIDTERTPLRFRSERTEAPFDRIQNVSLEMPNLMANLLNWGTVKIYTAGGEGRLDFTFVRNPRRVQAEIFRRLAAHEEAQRSQLRERVDLAEWFSVFERTQRS